MNKSNDLRQVLTVLAMILILAFIPSFLVLFTHLTGRIISSILLGVALYFIFLRKK